MSLKITSISIVIVFKTISILVQAQSDLALRAFDSASHTTFPTSWATNINLRPVCHFVKADICYWWWNSWISSNWWVWWNTPPWTTNGLLWIFTSQSESGGNLSSKLSQADLHFLRYSSLFTMPPIQVPAIDFSDVNTVEDEFEIPSLSGDDGCPAERNQHVSQINPTHWLVILWDYIRTVDRHLFLFGLVIPLYRVMAFDPCKAWSNNNTFVVEPFQQM